ncbi:bacterial lipocalin [Herbaspirillum sp. CF444]|uniref:lipocalin family protein n=1 Tax=Herbaspirillum sp. CF444 TaxID=1144319 RepID=UPI0002726399|nr:lipocalin family protein [Herbaspirillum sp. CF444]EJL84369.1 bacterial lipocalin [Herbaspirillum sp. CF444]
MNTQLARRLFSSLMLACAAAAALPAVAQEVVTVPLVDLKRYVGKWYEIARFPNSFQKKCIANATAEYRVRADGDIDVINRCKVEGGVLDQADGLAHVTAGSNNAKLQVRFAPAWLAWFPLVWGDYWIIDLDPDYSIATVGTPSRDYLWILSRKPALSTAEYEAAVNNATKQGFDTSKLVKTPQQ